MLIKKNCLRHRLMSNCGQLEVEQMGVVSYGDEVVMGSSWHLSDYNGEREDSLKL